MGIRAILILYPLSVCRAVGLDACPVSTLSSHWILLISCVYRYVEVLLKRGWDYNNPLFFLSFFFFFLFLLHLFFITLWEGAFPYTPTRQLLRTGDGKCILVMVTILQLGLTPFYVSGLFCYCTSFVRAVDRALRVHIMTLTLKSRFGSILQQALSHYFLPLLLGARAHLCIIILLIYYTAHLYIIILLIYYIFCDLKTVYFTGERLCETSL